MGSSRGQSTLTIDKWPDWLDNNPGDTSVEVPNYETDYLRAAEFLSQSSVTLIDPNYNNLSLIAPQDPDELAGINALALRGRNGDVSITKGKAVVQDTVKGSYVDGTKTFYATAKAKANTKSDGAFTADIIPKMGGSLYIIGDPDPAPVLLSTTLTSGSSAKYRGRMDAELDATEYRKERVRQHDALPAALQYGEQEVVDGEAVRRAGLYVREYSQSVLDDDFRKKLDTDLTRIRQVEIHGNALRTMIGAQEARTEPFHRPSKAGAIIGGAASGAAIGTMIAPGIGTAVGAFAGGALGALSA